MYSRGVRVLCFAVCWHYSRLVAPWALSRALSKLFPQTFRSFVGWLHIVLGKLSPPCIKTDHCLKMNFQKIILVLHILLVLMKLCLKLSFLWEGVLSNPVCPCRTYAENQLQSWHAQGTHVHTHTCFINKKYKTWSSYQNRNDDQANPDWNFATFKKRCWWDRRTSACWSSSLYELLLINENIGFSGEQDAEQEPWCCSQNGPLLMFIYFAHSLPPFIPLFMLSLSQSLFLFLSLSLSIPPPLSSSFPLPPLLSLPSRFLPFHLSFSLSPSLSRS